MTRRVFSCGYYISLWRRVCEISTRNAGYFRLGVGCWCWDGL